MSLKIACLVTLALFSSAVFCQESLDAKDRAFLELIRSRGDANAVKPVAPAISGAMDEERGWVMDGKSKADAEGMSAHQKHEFSQKPSSQDFLEAAQLAGNDKKFDVEAFQAGGDSKSSTDDYTTYVFVSLGMPERVMKALMNQAAGDANTVLVLRGWKPPHFNQMIRKLNALHDTADVNVIIEPRLFKLYQIDRVPVVLHKTRKFGWQRITGEISIEGAQRELEGGKKKAIAGDAYAIAEPDVLEEIQKRMESYDWDKALAQVKEKIRNYDQRFDLPTAEKDETYDVDLTITVKQDITREEGQIVVPAGTQVNPLSFLTVPTKFIFFDPDSEQQIAQAKKWASSYGDTLVIATHLVDPAGGPTISDKIGQPVYPLNSQLAQRFALKAVPSMAWQYGDLLRVEVKKP